MVFEAQLVFSLAPFARRLTTYSYITALKSLGYFIYVYLRYEPSSMLWSAR
jgi:hypothetical protein